MGEKRRFREACDTVEGQQTHGEGGGAGDEKLEKKIKKEAKHKHDGFEGKENEEAVKKRKRPLTEESNEEEKQQHE